MKTINCKAWLKRKLTWKTIKKFILANVYSMAIQVALLASLSLIGFDLLTSTVAAKIVSWGVFFVQLALGK